LACTHVCAKICIRILILIAFVHFFIKNVQSYRNYLLCSSTVVSRHRVGGLCPSCPRRWRPYCFSCPSCVLLFGVVVCVSSSGVRFLFSALFLLSSLSAVASPRCCLRAAHALAAARPAPAPLAGTFPPRATQHCASGSSSSDCTAHCGIVSVPRPACSPYEDDCHTLTPYDDCLATLLSIRLLFCIFVCMRCSSNSNSCA